MIVFLTSSPTGPLDRSRNVEGFDEKNQFLANLRKYWIDNSKCLIITAFPDDDTANDEMRQFMSSALQKSGLSSQSFDIWDRRTTDFSTETLNSYDVIFLGGGHVPTQNAFFHEIGLREKIAKFDGIIIGISAGTMNSARLVYAQPELPGEALDPGYQRFLQGLSLTETNILPHYQMVKDSLLDGMRLYEDITYADSIGRQFLVLPDGSYLLIDNGTETIYGEAYRITDTRIEKICEENQTYIWQE
ncbi:MAG: Type 1 glutamine amidotransferase-like domain-containing protein [Roseburia sp.]